MAYITAAIYADDTKATPIASGITRTTNVTQDIKLNEVPTYGIDILLADPKTSAINKGHYVEVSVGVTAPTLWTAGYVTDLQRNASEADLYTLTLEDAMIGLTHFHQLGDHEFNYPAYQSVMDMLNGTHGVGNPATPGTKGILDGTGWTATWIGGGTPPGLGDLWRTDWESAFNNVTLLAEHYGFFFRSLPGSKKYGGTLQVGPLGDANTTSIWGGQPLLTQLKAAHPDLTAPNAYYAQKQGYVQIVDASNDRDMTQVANLIWGVGAGSFQTLVTLKHAFGDVFQPNGTTLVSGVSTWQPNPNGRVYYVKAGSKTTYQGNTFELVAAQQNDGNFAYGVVDRTSAGKWGVIEATHVDKHAHDWNALLSSVLGFLESGHDPVDSWSFVVRFPLNDANRVPPTILPGQQLASINYEGLVADALDFDATTQQFYGTGQYSYLKFPAVADVGATVYNNLMRITEVQTSIKADGAEATLTLGKSKRNNKKTDDATARRMMRQRHRKDVGSVHRYTKASIQGVPWLFFGSSYEDAANEVMVIPPSGHTVANVSSETTFGDNHHMGFDINVSDVNQTLDFMFAKPKDGSLKSLDVSGRLDASGNPVTYGVLRLAFTGSTLTTGFYTTDGVTDTARGAINPSTLLDANKRLAPGVYHVGITWSQGHYQATIQTVNPNNLNGIGSVHHLARWNDVGSGATPQYIKHQGSIGFHVRGGTANAQVMRISGHEHQHHVVHRRHLAASHPGKHNWHNFIHAPTGYNSGTNIVSGSSQVNGVTARLADDAGQTIQHDDGTPVSFTADQTWTAQPGDFIVYNASASGVTDGHGGTVAAKAFGGVVSIDTANPTFDHVFQVGRLSTALDSNGLPWFTSGGGGSTSISQKNLQNITIQANSVADLSITTQKIADLAVTAQKIGNVTITAAQIADATITGGKISQATIDGNNIKLATIAGVNIGSATIAGTNIATATIQGQHIQNATITTGHLQDETATRAKIHSHNHGRIHHKNIRLVPSNIGGSAGAYTTTLTVQRLASPAWIEVDNGTKYYVAATTLTGVAQDAWLVYDRNQANATVSTTSATFSTLPAGTNLTLSTYDSYFIVGRISSVPDATTGQLWTEGWHHGLHQAMGGDIANLAVTSGHIKNLSINSAHIQNATITGTQIAAATIQGSHIAAATIDGTNIKSATIQGGNIATAAISAAHIGDAQINTNHLVAESVARAAIHRHNQSRYHFRNIRLVPSNIAGSAGSYTTTLGVTLLGGVSRGSIHVDNGTIYYVAATTLTAVPQDAWLVYDTTQANATLISTTATVSTMPAATNFTATSYSNLIILGRISNVPDATTAQLWTEGWHHALHQAAGGDIAAAAISSAHIKAATITGANIASATIDGTNVKGATIDGTNIKAATIDGTNIKTATIDGTTIKSATIDGTNLKAATVDATNIKNATITAVQIANATITTTQIGSATITGTNIANGSITASHLGSASVTAAAIGTLSIDATKIQNLTITAGQIANLTVAKSKLHPANSTKFHITDGVLTVAQLGGTFQGGALASNQIALTWPALSIVRDDGQLIQAISASNASAPASVVGPVTAALPPLKVTEGQVLILNLSGGSINVTIGGVSTPVPQQNLAAVDANGIDFANPANDAVYDLGKLSTTVDAGTGLPHFATHHGNAHQKAGAHIQPSAVNTPHIKSNAIISSHVSTGAIHGGESSNPNHIASAAVQGTHVGAGQIANTHVAAGAIHGGESANINHIATGAVQGTHVGASQIGTTHVAALSIQGGVGTAKNHIVSGTVGSGEVGSAQIGNTHVATGAIHGGESANINHIASGAVQGTHVGASQIGVTHVAAGAIQGGVGTSKNHISTGTVGSGEVGTNQIGTAHIASGVVQGGVGTSKNHIVTGTVGSGEVGASQIGTAHVAAGSLHGGEASNPNHYASGSILAGHIGTGQVNLGTHINTGTSLPGANVGSGISATNVTAGAMSGANRLSWSASVVGPVYVNHWAVQAPTTSGRWSVAGTQNFGTSLGGSFNSAHSNGWGIAISVSAINGPNPFGYDATTTYLQPRQKLNNGVGTSLFDPSTADTSDILWNSNGGMVGIAINDVRVDNQGAVYVLFQLIAQYNGSFVGTTFDVEVFLVWRGLT